MIRLVIRVLFAALSVGLAISSTRNRRARQRHRPARRQSWLNAAPFKI